MNAQCEKRPKAEYLHDELQEIQTSLESARAELRGKKPELDRGERYRPRPTITCADLHGD